MGSDPGSQPKGAGVHPAFDRWGAGPVIGCLSMAVQERPGSLFLQLLGTW